MFMKLEPISSLNNKARHSSAPERIFRHSFRGYCLPALHIRGPTMLIFSTQPKFSKIFRCPVPANESLLLAPSPYFGGAFSNPQLKWNCRDPFSTPGIGFPIVLNGKIAVAALLAFPSAPNDA
jgi:hypothetical protein